MCPVAETLQKRLCWYKFVIVFNKHKTWYLPALSLDTYIRQMCATLLRTSKTHLLYIMHIRDLVDRTYLGTYQQVNRWNSSKRSKVSNHDLKINHLNWPVARQFCMTFLVLNWSFETPRSSINYSFCILMNANIKFSLLKSLKSLPQTLTDWLWRQIDVYREKVTWLSLTNMPTPRQRKGLLPYCLFLRLVGIFASLYISVFLLASSTREPPPPNFSMRITYIEMKITLPFKNKS